MGVKFARILELGDSQRSLSYIKGTLKDIFPQIYFQGSFCIIEAFPKGVSNAPFSRKAVLRILSQKSFFKDPFPRKGCFKDHFPRKSYFKDPFPKNDPLYHELEGPSLP